MAKTLGSILTIAGTAALVASGVGAIGASVLISIGGSSSIFGISTATLLSASAALTAAGGLIGSIGQQTPRPPATETALKTERPARISGYGRMKKDGALML